MPNLFQRWIQKYFSDPEGVILGFLLTLGFVVVIFWGQMLAPLLAGVVLAYLLEGIVRGLEQRGVARMPSVALVYTVFVAALLLFLFGLIPLLSIQVTQLIEVKVPQYLDQGQQLLLQLPQRYPTYITAEQVEDLMRDMRSAVGTLGQHAWSISVASISGLFTLAIYLVIVPVMVFFLLKDKRRIIEWFTSFLPRERHAATQVWQDMDRQIGNYIRGKFAEVLIVGVITYVAFALFGLQYASLLAALVGLSCMVPYIGVAVVTVPVAALAFFQFGWSAEFGYLMLAHGIIQALDGNVLVPLLFSEAVSLHPIAIISAVVVFGGLWGFWGVFFAIPLATLVNAVIVAWPRASVEPIAAEGDGAASHS